MDSEHQSLRWAVMAFLGDLFCLAPSLWCSGLTRCSEKSILEISQGNTDFIWPLENLFQGQKPRRFENFENGYKWRNEADKRHWLIFIFHPGPPKRRKKPEVWKNRLRAQAGSGYWETGLRYQNPRKGTETASFVVALNHKYLLRYQNPRKGTETTNSETINFSLLCYVTKIPVRGLKQQSEQGADGNAV